MAKKKKKVPAKKESSNTKQEAVLQTIMVDEVVPFDGLNIGKKEKHYKHPAIVVENRWATLKKKDAVKKALVDLIIPNFSLDPKRSKIGIRLIRETEQFSPDYKFETVKTVKTVPRKQEEKVEEVEVGTEYFADFIQMGSERKTEKVKAVAFRGKDVLIETEEGLKYCKVHQLYTEDLQTKVKDEVVGKTKAEVFRFIGIDFDITDGNKAKIKFLKKDELYLIKGVIKLTKITNKLVKDKEAEGTSCFEIYGTADPEATFTVPGKILVKFDDNGISLYILLEKTPTKDGLKKSFNLFEMYKVASKKKEKKEMDLQSKIEAAFGGVDEDDEDTDDDF